jgi:hypothetical protein
MTLSKYLETNFKKKKYGFGNIYSDSYLKKIKEYEKSNNCIFIKNKDTYLFNNKNSKFTLFSDSKTHKIIDYSTDKLTEYNIQYYNFRKLYKIINNLITKI